MTLKEKQLELVEWTKKQVEKNPTKDLHQYLKMQERILYSLGYRKKRFEKKDAPKDAFKRKEMSEGEVKKASTYDNSDAPKNAFKYQPPTKEGNLKNQINNEVVANPFKENNEVNQDIDKNGKKWSMRLNKDKVAAIKKMNQDGFNIFEISEELWIAEKAIRKALGMSEQSNTNLIADNSKSDLETLKSQLND
jgi:hypothetical protein